LALCDWLLSFPSVRRFHFVLVPFFFFIVLLLPNPKGPPTPAKGFFVVSLLDDRFFFRAPLSPPGVSPQPTCLLDNRLVFPTFPWNPLPWQSCAGLSSTKARPPLFMSRVCSFRRYSPVLFLRGRSLRQRVTARHWYCSSKSDPVFLRVCLLERPPYT